MILGKGLLDRYVQGDRLDELSNADRAQLASEARRYGLTFARIKAKRERAVTDASVTADVIKRGLGIDVTSVSRRRHVVRARHAVMAILRQQGHSLPAIAEAVGLEDHTTVIYGLRVVARTPSLRDFADDIARVLAGSLAVQDVRVTDDLFARVRAADGRRAIAAGRLVELRDREQKRKAAAQEIEDLRCVRDARIIALAKRGGTYAEIALEMGISKQRVSQVCRPVLGRRRKAYVPLAEKDKEAINDMARRGLSVRGIATHLNRPRDTIRGYCNRAGIATVHGQHHNAQYSDAARARAVGLVASGSTYSQAALTTGMTRNAVAGAVNRSGKEKKL